MRVCVEASTLQASLSAMSVPLERVRAARRSLSFTWCSVLAAVSLIVVVHVAIAAVRRYLVAGRLRRFFEAPPPPLPPPGVDVQSPSSDVSAAGTPPQTHLYLSLIHI